MTLPPSCPSEIEFASLLVYSPDGDREASQQSRAHVLRIKRGSPAHMERIGVRAAECAARGQLGRIFDRKPILVPVPRSRPLKDRGALWPAMRIAQELVRRGLAHDVHALLERSAPVVKSALLRDGSKRPGPDEHLKTLRVVDVLAGAASRVVLVDDVVTWGATLLGCAGALLHALPRAEILAFAAVRTMSGQEIEDMLAPAVGTIRLREGRPHREP